MSVNPQVMNEMVIPEGVNRDTLIDNLVMELAEMSIIYSEPHTLQKLIGIWSRRRLYVWTELYKTLLYRYDPIANYDRIEERVYRDDYEGSGGRDINHVNNGQWSQDYTHINNGEWSENRNGNSTTSYTENTSGKTNGTGTEERNTNTDTTHNQTEHSENLHKVWGFNSEVSADSYQDIGDNTISGTSKTTEGMNGTTTNNQTTSGDTEGKSTVTLTENSGNTHSDNDTDKTGNTHGDTDTDTMRESDNHINFHAEKMRARGNIGVTTTQQMIEQQRKIVEFDMYKYIIDDFKQQFCLMVY